MSSVFTPNPDPTADPAGDRSAHRNRRYAINQMRIWELEQKDVIPQNLITLSPKGSLRVGDLTGLCEVDTDPMAVSRSVIPVIPVWLRQFLLSTLYGNYGRSPSCCKILCGALHPSTEPIPTPVSVHLVRNLIAPVAGRLRIILSDIKVIIVAATRGLPLASSTYSTAKKLIGELLGCDDPTQMPNQVGTVVQMLQDLIDGKQGIIISTLRDNLNAVIVEPYAELLSTLETVDTWAGEVLSAFDASLEMESGSDVSI